MPLVELLPTLQTLPKADKLRVIQFLVFQLALEEGINLLEPGEMYPIWTPLLAFDAAEVLLQMLNKGQPHVKVP